MMKPPLTILCATDLSPDADFAVQAANSMAKLFGSRLVFVHAVPYSAPLRVLFPQLVQGTTDRLLAMSRVAAETVATRIASLTGRSASDLDVRVDVGPPDEVIVGVAEESHADVLVIGARGSDSVSGTLGETAVRIARHAHCPVFVVREGPAKGPVLAATDLSDHAEKALSVAAMLSAKLGEPMVALHVVDYSPIVVIPEAFGPGIPIPLSEEEHQAIVKSATDRLAETLNRFEIKCDQMVEEGTPSEKIIAAAGELDASILVVSTEGGSSLRRMLLGSVAEDVVRQAPCSVMLVRHHHPGGHE